MLYTILVFLSGANCLTLSIKTQKLDTIALVWSPLQFFTVVNWPYPSGLTCKHVQRSVKSRRTSFLTCIMKESRRECHILVRVVVLSAILSERWQRKLGISGCCVTFAKTYSAKNLNERWQIKFFFFLSDDKLSLPTVAKCILTI